MLEVIRRVPFKTQIIVVNLNKAAHILALHYWPKLIFHFEINSKKLIKSALLLKFLKLQLFDEGILWNFEERQWICQLQQL